MLQRQEEDVLEQYYDYPDSQLLKLQIRQSTVPHAGLAIFATKDFREGQIIAEAYGSVMRTRNSEDRQFWRQMTMALIDSEYCVMTRGPYSKKTDIIKWEPQKYKTSEYDQYRMQRQFPVYEGMTRNSHPFYPTKQKTFLVAFRNILAGQEIHMKFCYSYWNFYYGLYEQSKTKSL